MGCLCSRRRGSLQRGLADSDEFHSIDLAAITMLGTYPSVPISYADLKKELRQGLMSDARIYWWPFLPRILPGSRINMYPKIKEICVQKYEWAKANFKDLPSLFEVANEKDRTYEIMLLLGSQYDLEEPGLVVPVVGMLSLFIPSPEIVFGAACDILDRQDWFVSPTAARHRMKLFSFRQLVANFLPKEAFKLESIGALEDDYLNLIFLDFFLPLLPAIYCAKIFDIFLLEGNKVLHRFGLALIAMCKGKLETEVITSALEYWNMVKYYCNSGGMEWSRVVSAAFAIGPSAFSKLSSSNTSLTRAALLRYEVMAKVHLGEALHKPLNLNYKDSANRSSTANVLSANAVEGVSKLVDSSSGNRLRMFLPETVNMEGFKMVFSTQADGWSLGTLYAKTENLCPCLLIVRTLTQGAIVGVFIASAISPPSGAVRGDGNSFVCRLDGPEAGCYRWVGKKDLSHGSASSSSLDSGPGSPSPSPGVSFTRNQFGVFKDDCIMIGGSELKGENALYLSGDLSTVVFGASDTFGNAPLAAHDPSGTAAVADIEVLCGAKSVLQAQASGALDVKRRMWSTADAEKESGQRRHGDSESKGNRKYTLDGSTSAPATHTDTHTGGGNALGTVNPIFTSFGGAERKRTISFSGSDYAALAANEV
jgi:hypothetical protein